MDWHFLADLFERSYRLVALKRVITKHGETGRKL
jgi:hypothetical protein